MILDSNKIRYRNTNIEGNNYVTCGTCIHCMKKDGNKYYCSNINGRYFGAEYVTLKTYSKCRYYNLLEG